MWIANDNVLYYTEATKAYLSGYSAGMFYNSGFKTIDVSDFDITYLRDASNMFAYSANLTTIYASESWDMSDVEDASSMFQDLENIIGGQGTTYYDWCVPQEYAQIDGGPSNPGYFTLPGHKADMAFMMDGYDFKDKLYSMETTGKEFRKATLQEYNQVKDSLTEDNVVSTYNSPYTVYMWETNTKVLYYSETSNIYLNENCSEMFEFQGFSIIDLSGFKTDNVMYIEYMFGNCSSLTTIYVADTWDLSNVEYQDSMFYDVENIVGGAGTTYDENNIYPNYAHIDGGPSDPGYLTDIADKN